MSRFYDSEDIISRIDEQSAVSMMPNNMEAYKLRSEDYVGHVSRTFTNRLFERVSSMKGVGILQFNRAVDPQGIMSAMARTHPKRHVYTEDNSVLYYKRRNQKNGEGSM